MNKLVMTLKKKRFWVKCAHWLIKSHEKYFKLLKNCSMANFDKMKLLFLNLIKLIYVHTYNKMFYVIR